MNTKKITLISIAATLITFVIFPAVLVWAADPCQIFHKPFSGFFYHGFSGDARCQDAGFINSYLQDPLQQFDSIITGSSLSGNFKSEYIAKKNNLQRTLSLGLPGPRPIELQIIVQRALATPNVRHIFWEVFPFQFSLFPNDNIETLAKLNEFPLYLYNQGRLDDYRYLFNRSTLTASIGVMQHLNYYDVSDIDRYGYWKHDCTSEKTCKPFYSQAQINQLKKEYTHPNLITRSPEEIDRIDFSAADKYLLSTLLPYCNNPDRKFDLIFPPLSYLWYARQSQQSFDYQLYFLRYIVDKTQSCKNIRNFAFNNEQWISGDLAHYHDPRHFYGGVHDYIVDSIAAGKHIITPSNISAFEKQFIENVNSYTPRASTAAELVNSPH